MQFKYFLSTIVCLTLASGVLSTPLSADITPRTKQELQALDLLKRSFPDHTYFSKDALLIARYLEAVVLNQRAVPAFEPRAAKPRAPKAAPAPKAGSKAAGSKSGKGKSPACPAKGGKRLRAREDLCIPDKAIIAAAIGGNPQKYFFYARDADETHIDVEKVDTFMKAHAEYKGYLTLAGELSRSKNTGIGASRNSGTELARLLRRKRRVRCMCCCRLLCLGLVCGILKSRF